MVIPLFGAVLILPPLVGVFLVPVRFAGAPLIVLYLFSVWMVLIVVTALLARRMQDASPGEKSQVDSLPDSSGDET